MSFISPVPPRILAVARKRTAGIEVKHADSAEEFEEVYRLNHATYAVELGQEPCTDDQRLLDKHQEKCVYIVAKKYQEVIGMAAITRPGNIFSLESSVKDPSIMARIRHEACEFRRVAVAPRYRHGGVYILLVEALAQYCIEHHIPYVFTSAVADHVTLYEKSGFFMFDRPFTKGRATYQPMMGAMPGASNQKLRAYLMDPQA